MASTRCRIRHSHPALAETGSHPSDSTRATHFFDNIAYAKNPDIRGSNWAEPMFFAQNDYDPEARADAEREVVEFFRSVGGRDQATD